MELKQRLAALQRQAGVRPATQSSDTGALPAPRATNRPMGPDGFRSSDATCAPEPAPVSDRLSEPDSIRHSDGAGRTDAAPVAIHDQSLSLRVERLGVRARSRPDTATLATLLQAEPLADGLLVRHQVFPLVHRHGRQAIGRLLAVPPHALGSHPDPGRLLFLDTETTGLAGGTGTLPFLVGLARLTDAGLHLCQFLLTGFRAEQLMLEHVSRWLDGCGQIVSFNGKRFDVPLLVTRYRLCRLANPLAGQEHLDLLYPTRMAYGSRWSDCRLQTAERNLLAFERTHDLPGAEVPEAWFDLVRHGDDRLMPAVMEHNRHDLLSLALLLPALAEAVEDPQGQGADVLAISRLHRRRGHAVRALMELQAAADDLDTAGRLELAWLHRTRKEWPAAVAIWLALAETDCAPALEHLAKYHEHVERDLDAALGAAVRLQALEPRCARHAQRRTRLQRRLGG